MGDGVLEPAGFHQLVDLGQPGRAVGVADLVDQERQQRDGVLHHPQRRQRRLGRRHAVDDDPAVRTHDRRIELGVAAQIEFDDRPLCQPYGVQVLWNPTDDDFQPKPAALLDAGVQFAQKALASPENKIYIHCAAGVHRAPMMTLALLRAQGWALEDALETVQSLRPVVDWADVYVESVERYISTKYQVPSAHPTAIGTWYRYLVLGTNRLRQCSAWSSL